MLLSIGTLIVVAYLILSINVYLESFAFNRFSIGYGYVGPTEIRLILIALNTVVALGAGLDFVVADLQLTVFDLIGLAIAGTMIVLLARPRGPQPARAREKGARGAPSLSCVFPQIAGLTPAAPLHFRGPGINSHMRFGREETAAKAKPPGLSKETGKALIVRRLRARQAEPGHPRTAFRCARIRGARSSDPSLPSAARRWIAVGSGWPAATGRATGAHSGERAPRRTPDITSASPPAPRTSRCPTLPTLTMESVATVPDWTQPPWRKSGSG